MPTHTWLRAISVGISLLTMFATARAQAEIRFDLQPQPLSKALSSVGNIANVNVIYDSRVVEGLQAPPLNAKVGSEEALRRLLVGTQLSVVRVNDNTFIVKESGAHRVEHAGGPQSGAVQSPGMIHLADVGDTQGTGSSGHTSDGYQQQQGDAADRNGYQEVIVSAQKRSELLQDVPVPVTAINARKLIEENQLRLQDYYISVPGLSVVPVASTIQNLSIRGITTGSGSNPTVGITVDDVPYGSSTGLGGAGSVPDFDPGDLASVEVLRGPQGTLYGASSMGGLIKYVTVDPSTERLSGSVQAGVSDVYNGRDPGYNVRGSVNVPLGDQLAVRASAFSRIDPGYIDNVETGEKGVNEAHVRGGRVSALWQVAPEFSVKLSALYQDYKGNGNDDVDVQAGLGDLQQSYLPGTGGYDRKFQAYAATLKAKLGGIELVSVTGYNSNSTSESVDGTYALGTVTKLLYGFPGAAIFVDSYTHKINQEIRLSSNIGTGVDWLLGGFYTHESSPANQPYFAENPASGALVARLADYDTSSGLTEYAGFADLTFHLTSQFDVQVGGRESQIKQSATQLNGGLLYGDITTITGGTSKNSAFTYLVTPQYHVSRDLMVYARLASGYRAGGPNVVAGKPSQYDPDKTQNYELGVKGEFLDRRLSLDASLYYIGWKDIQVLLLDFTTFQTYTINANRAKSQGLELSGTARPLEGLSIGAWVSYDDAKLTEGFPPVPISTAYGVAGDRLPYTSRFSGNVSLQQDFQLADRVTGYLGGSVSYVGDRVGNFTATAARENFPAYARTDLRAGAKYDSWTANFFVLNLTDKRAAVRGGLGSFPAFAFNYIQPRTVGLNLIKSF